MSEDLHQIDDLFRSGLEGKEDAPSPQVWENIEARLNEKERRPAAGFFGRKVAAALVVLLGSAALFAAGYFIGGSNHHHDEAMPEVRPSVPRGGSGGNPGDTIGSGVSVEGPRISIPETRSVEHLADQEADVAELPKSVNRNDSTLTANQTSSGKAGEERSAAKAGKQVATGRDKRGEDVAGSAGTGAAGNKNEKSSARNTGSETVKEQQGNANTGDATKAVNEEKPNTAAVELKDQPAPKVSQEPAEGPTAPAQQRLPGLGKKPDEKLAKDAPASVPAASKATIPVKDRKKGSLNLPAFTLTPVVAWQKNRVKVEDDGSRWGQEMKEGMERTEHTPSRISAGLLADVKASRNITIQTGLLLTQFDVHIDPKKVIAVKDIDGKVRYRFDCSAGTYFLNPKQGSYPRVGDTSSTRYSTNALNYINIPVNIKWHFGNSKMQFFATAGAGMNFLMKQDLNAGLNHQYHYEGGRAANLKSSFFNGMIGAGMNYSFSERIGLTLSPQYQFAITPMNETMPVKSMPKSFHVQAGLQIKLK